MYLFVIDTKEHCVRVIKCDFEYFRREGFLCQNYTPLYEKGIKGNENKSMETNRAVSN